MHTKRFANPSFDAVADDGSTQRPRDSEADPRSRRVWPFEAKRREDWTGNADAVVIDDAKVRGFEDPGSSRKRQAIWQTGRLFRR